MSKVVVESAGEEKVAEGEGPLFDLATEQDLPIPFGCTAARCGVCQVKVLEGELAPAEALERATLEAFECPPEIRLACQADVVGDVRLKSLA